MDETQLRSHLQCPVCTFLTHNAKFFACKNGHQICEHCYDKVNSDSKKCPQGRCQYYSPPTRERVIENMISEAFMKINCQNAGRGCHVEHIREALILHEVECQYRLVPCPEADCQRLVVFSHLHDHQLRDDGEHSGRPVPHTEEEEHSFKIALSNEDIADVMDSFYVNKGWIVGGFCFYRIIMKKTNCWYTWVTIQAGPNKAAEWKYTVKVENKVSGVSTEMTGHVAPVDWTVKKVMESGCYLTLTSAVIERLIELNPGNYEHMLPLVYTVKKIGN
eukprot:GFUD01020670.1.p1 GENE.GFUD01020670.1~~GFUD01020670.1.p1  ORF type:complete len:276 (-),score=47.71 GFUD01020670.1:75-902(-)